MLLIAATVAPILPAAAQITTGISSSISLGLSNSPTRNKPYFTSENWEIFVSYLDDMSEHKVLQTAESYHNHPISLPDLIYIHIRQDTQHELSLIQNHM